MPARARPWVTLGLLLGNACWGVTGLDRLEYQDCRADSDCGPPSSGHQCVTGRCVLPQPSGGDSGGGAGAPNGLGGGGAGAPGGSGGEAGAQESCRINAECIALHSGDPYLCRNQRCVGLTTADCPGVLGFSDQTVILTGGDPIVLGAYVWLSAGEDDNSIQYSSPLANYELAVSEFNRETVPGTSYEDERGVLLVVCRAHPSASEASLQHLVNTLEVPGIVAPVPPAGLNWAVNLTNGRVLFINPAESTSIQADVNQNKVLWHLLGSPEDYAPPMAALLRRTEAYLKAQRVGTSDETTPLHVTLVESDLPTLTVRVETLYPLLRFNGMSAPENVAAGYLRRVGTKSSMVHDVPDALDALDDLEQHPPDVVVAMATSEFAEQVLGRLELDWAIRAPNQPRPFYLLAPELFGSRTVEVLASQLASRTVGIAAARDANPGPYQDYVSRLVAPYPGSTSTTYQRPNYYDAVYYLLYSVLASTPSELTGEHLAQGFLLIIDAQALAVDMGPIPLRLQAPLFDDVNHRIQLMGTMGPPNFDLVTGTRKVPISAWCLASNGSYQVDVLRYDEVSGEFAGTFPCFTGF